MESSIEAGGTIVLETLGPYFLARCYIRDSGDFYRMVLLLYRLFALLLPFALIEALTGRNVAREIFSLFWTTRPDSAHGMRLGLFRTQTVFDHAILFGVCMGSILSFVHLVLGRNVSFFKRWWRTGIIGLTAFLSLSSAPIAGIALQTVLLAWKWLLRPFQHKWRILWVLGCVAYVFVELASNQTAIQFYISYLTFDPHTGWHRLLIWDYGSASVMANPLFGIGFGEWERAAWMSGSVDMFWLLLAMRHGIPASLFMMLGFFLIVANISRKRGTEQFTDYKTGFVIVMVATFFVGWTVHFWGEAYALFLFLLGSGRWMMDVNKDDEPLAKKR